MFFVHLCNLSQDLFQFLLQQYIKLNLPMQMQINQILQLKNQLTIIMLDHWVFHTQQYLTSYLMPKTMCCYQQANVGPIYNYNHLWSARISTRRKIQSRF